MKLSGIDKLKDEEYRGRIFLAIIVVVILGGIVFQYYKQKDIKLNEGQITGRITKFLKHGRASFGVRYEYYVNGELYAGQVGISPFSCDNGKKGCVGEEFEVYYSIKNPEYSRIDLGKYEQYKNTVEFFD
ncbi:hypothetical protein [Flagellimonas eckloniae]|uniref:DUF3592 domain-containing protein n=1 Tax=Flagellimonas eckloniae TaxID=346185 RepID=A0A0Q0WV83_9FLAO|nr:hypothetical protein [Allomuricauda eckloniae]KQC29384.1 hypothetical protein AAY42_05305 [Allomuricauda eckloniae]